MPSPGKIEVWRMPGGPGVRLDSHVYTGYSIPPFYDSMIAKLITYGKNRQDAITVMLRALREIEVKPIKTTAPLHTRILSHPRFRQGSVTTKFIESTIFGAGKTDESEASKEKK